MRCPENAGYKLTHPGGHGFGAQRASAKFSIRMLRPAAKRP
jgi:hypothetical protein